MKRKAAAWLFLLCLLSACGKQKPVETAWSEAQMAQAIWNTQGQEDCQTLLYGEEKFSLYVADAYRIDPADLAGGAVFYAGGVSAQEVAVLRLTDAGGAGGAETALNAYIDSRAGAFAGYAPEQYAIVENSGTAGRGQYVALLIGPDLQAAQDAFAACFTAAPPEEHFLPEPAVQTAAPVEAEPSPQPPDAEDAPGAPPVQPPDESQDSPQDEPASVPQPEPDNPASQQEPDNPVPQPEPEPEPVPDIPEEPWSYDRERIVRAWQSGSRDGLWEQDLAILEVLDSIPALTDESLSDYGRELALHDWMIAWAEYDPGALSSNPWGEPMPDNDNPYGFLTGKKGICLGYASTFQLLMDLSGIPCRTVSGMAHAGTAEHAWNLVQLDGDWYAVDVTWDDPVSSRPVPQSMAHRYFNVTGEYLRQHDHQWDESGLPEAEGTALAWVP